MMRDNFEYAFELTVGHEGGYTDNSADRGNWTSGVIGEGLLKGTKYGIAAHSHPDLDIRNLTLEQAREIYRAEYWDPCGCDEWGSPLDVIVFDAAINNGRGRAIRFLQLAAGVNSDGALG